MNDEILAAGGSDWQDWRKFELERINRPAASAMRARAGSVLLAEFGQAGLPVIKDPRMCRLMPFWSSVFRDAEWSVRALLPLRSPLEVAWSLHRRNGIAPSYGCLLWLRHVLEAEAETREMPRAVLSWQDFLDDRTRTLARVGECLDLAWPNWCERALADIDAYVSADLRHHRASADQMRADPAINDFVREAYAAMLELVADPKNRRVRKRLDDVRARFETGTEFFDQVIRELQEEVRRLRSYGATQRFELATPHAVARR